MALIDCSECGNKVSEKANLCPSCGNPIIRDLDDIEGLELIEEAESYHLEAEIILNSLQANIEVYGSNSSITGATPADVNLALKYINRSLENFPENTKYMNLKALLLSEGLGRKEEAISLLEEANKIDPRNITIESNLNALKSAGCFVATAAYGSPFVWQINSLRAWRRDKLLNSENGRKFISLYNKYSPRVASVISHSRVLRIIVRGLLWPIVRFISINHKPNSR